MKFSDLKHQWTSKQNERNEIFEQRSKVEKKNAEQKNSLLQLFFKQNDAQIFLLLKALKQSLPPHYSFVGAYNRPIGGVFRNPAEANWHIESAIQDSGWFHLWICGEIVLTGSVLVPNTSLKLEKYELTGNAKVTALWHYWDYPDKNVEVVSSNVHLEDTIARLFIPKE